MCNLRAVTIRQAISDLYEEAEAQLTSSLTSLEELHVVEYAYFPLSYLVDLPKFCSCRCDARCNRFSSAFVPESGCLRLLRLQYETTVFVSSLYPLRCDFVLICLC
jgi:hypothetical protein